MHIFHAAAVLGADGDDIYAGGVDTAVPENIRKFCYILFNAVKNAGEKVAKIVRKYFLRADICCFA